LLIDAKNTLYRHNYTSNLVDSQGNKVSGIYGMYKEITTLIQKFKPSNVIIVWDKGQSRERCKLYPEYKGTRKREDDEKVLENLKFQMLKVKQLFRFLPVKQIAIDGLEADDIIGFFCEKLKGAKMIVSNDSDFHQLVNEDVRHYLPSKKVLLTSITINEFLGFPCKYYVLWKSIVGDTSDNIKGVYGIGPKKAASIINKRKEHIFSDAEKEIIKLNLKLIRIGKLLDDNDKHNIVTQYKKQLNTRMEGAVLRKIFVELGFKSLLLNFGQNILAYKELNRSESHGKEA